jgi:hypothetical protein
MKRTAVACAAVAATLGILLVPGSALAQTGVKTVRYDGYTFNVPSNWPVYQLGRNSTQCVRYDKNAVYLGAPGVNQQCPPNLIGRADTVSIAPSSGSSQPATGPAIEMQSAEVGGGPAAAATPKPGVTVSATYGADPGAVRQVLSSVRSTGTGAPVVLHQLAPVGQPAALQQPTRAVQPAQESASILAARAAKLAARAAAAASRAAALSSAPQRASVLARRAAMLAKRAAALASRASLAARASSPGAVTPPGAVSAPPGAVSTPPGPVSAPSRQSAPVSPTPPITPSSWPSASPVPAITPSPAPSATPSSAPSPSPSPPPSSSPASQQVATSYMTTPAAGFDTCTAPSLQAMQAWRHSYSAVAIYIGGAEMACDYGNLSASWVRSVRAMGWSLIPIYVGRQAPCNSFSQEIQPSYAAPEGTWAASDAVHDAQSLGLGTGSPIYFDMEAYNSGESWCRNSVLSFMNAWDHEIGALHYVSGMYSSAASGVEDMGNATSIYGRTLDKPQSIWFALWDGQANLTGIPYVLSSWWTPDRRIKQYQGGHVVTVDGIKLDIDSDWVQGAVYG